MGVREWLEDELLSIPVALGHTGVPAAPAVSTQGKDKLDLFFHDGAGRLRQRQYNSGWIQSAADAIDLGPTALSRTCRLPRCRGRPDEQISSRSGRDLRWFTGGTTATGSPGRRSSDRASRSCQARSVLASHRGRRIDWTSSR